MSQYLASLPDILTRGLEFTLIMSAASMLFSVLGGLLLGVLRALRNPLLDAVIIAYVEVLRGIPILVLMFFAFFGLPQLGINLVPVHASEIAKSLAAAVVALSLWGIANGTEIVRGAIFSIPRGQNEAGTALGLGWLQVMRFVILPQALRRMVPPYMSLFTAIVESSSLAALIGVFDLLETVRIRTETAHDLWFPLLFTVMVIYFLINYPISLLSQRLEKRLA